MTFSWLNYSILGGYLIAMVAIGVYLSSRQKSTEDYFLAGRRMPWLAVAMSMYASLTSAVTYMGLPGLAYRSNITLIVVCVISPLLAPFLILLFYPFYRRLRVTTSYEYIGLRFGRTARLTVSGLFLLARLGWLGTVIYAPALALATATGMNLAVSILLMGVLATVYTVLGGLSAVIWTDVAQFLILVAGAVGLAVALPGMVPGGFSGIMKIAAETGHIQLNAQVSLYEMSVLVVAVSFFFQMMQDYGTDQVTVQRLLAVRTYRGMIKAVLFNAVTDFVLVGTLLFIGLGLFAYYQLHPEQLAAGMRGDQILPYFITHKLPDGVSGLLITAIFAAAMSSMDSGINSMATVIMNDFILPFRKVRIDEKTSVRQAQWWTLLLGGFSTAVAFYVSTLHGIVEAFASFMSLFSAPVLALFLLGMLSRRARFDGWCVGAVLSVAVTFIIQHFTRINWVYYFPTAFVLCFSVGLLGSILKCGQNGMAPEELTLRGSWRRMDSIP
jgi:SSS family solute:Na+ symporter